MNNRIVEIDKEKIITHILEVWGQFQDEFINSLAIPTDIADNLYINYNLLTEAIQSAIVDIERMAEFHFSKQESVSEETKYPDNHKYSGFFSKWIAKIRPISYNNTDVEPTKSVLSINAIFAVWVFQSFLKYKIPTELMEHLIYTLHMRDERGETLSLIAYCCEEIGELEFKKS